MKPRRTATAPTAAPHAAGTGRDADALDATFFALSSELRRRMLDLLKRESGCNVNFVCEHFQAEIGRFAVMKHLAALERGGLVASAREGRERKLWFDATPIQFIHERWTSEFSAFWAARLTRLKYSAEGAEVRRLPPPSPQERMRLGPAVTKRAAAPPAPAPAATKSATTPTHRKERRHG